MKRLIDTYLDDWKDSTCRQPLILRGARQVGKTFSVLALGQRRFENVVVVDFEAEPTWHKFFDSSLNPADIVENLEIVTSQSIVPGKTLLFFDEIQACPRALMSLRYFYEKLPSLHVVAAGSLLEFALNTISFPVGRVASKTLFPLNFFEFLMAQGKQKLANILLKDPTVLPEPIHNMFRDELRRYFLVGGMPASIQQYLAGSMHGVVEFQKRLVDGFRADFPKYSTRTELSCLDQVFSTLARSVGNEVTYSRLAEGVSHATIKNSFHLLENAQLINKVLSVNPPQFPFEASINPKRAKALFLDIGLMQAYHHDHSMIFQENNLLNLYRGALAEQFVGQEIRSVNGLPLYYWSRAAKSSSSEVDYLVVLDGKVTPVEVKSGAAGRLKSLHVMRDQFPDIGVAYVFYDGPYKEVLDQNIVFVPLYYVFAVFS